jgi:hypothetical protein
MLTKLLNLFELVFLTIFLIITMIKCTHMKSRKLNNKLLHVVILTFLDVASMAEEPLETFPERRYILWFLSPSSDNRDQCRFLNSQPSIPFKAGTK